MITLGRRGDIHARRQALAYLRSQEVVHQLFSEVAPRFTDRPGGYTRIVKVGPRPGDSAPMAYLEFVDHVPRAPVVRAWRLHARKSRSPPKRPRSASERRRRVRLKLTLEYDGTDFHGWAAQPGLRTVEGVVGDALRSLFSVAENVAVAGRTDTGVHALGNVVSVDVGGGPPDRAHGRGAEHAAARRRRGAWRRRRLRPTSTRATSARSRSYRYRIYRRRERSPLEVRRSWWYPRRVDLDALAASADLLHGEHDFRAFTPTDTQHDVFLRTVLAASWHERGDHLDFEITADSFLRHMVRTLVGTMLDRQPDDIARLLEGRVRGRRQGRRRRPGASTSCASSTSRLRTIRRCAFPSSSSTSTARSSTRGR